MLITTGYSFIGWNTMRSGMGKDRLVGSSYKLGGRNDTLFAKWKLIPYNITYKLNGENEEDNPVTYTYESGNITLIPAEIKSCMFNGWYDDENFSGDSISFYPRNSTGYREFWAKWIIQDVCGNVYTEVKIGKQIWMVENLKTGKKIEGSSIPFLKDGDNWCGDTYSAFHTNGALNCTDYRKCSAFNIRCIRNA